MSRTAGVAVMPGQVPPSGTRKNNLVTQRRCWLSGHFYPIYTKCNELLALRSIKGSGNNAGGLDFLRSCLNLE